MITLPMVGQAVECEDAAFPGQEKVIGFVVGNTFIEGDVVVRVLVDRSAEIASEFWLLGEIEPASYEDTLALLADRGVDEAGWMEALRFELTGEAAGLRHEFATYLATLTRDPSGNLVYAPLPPVRPVTVSTQRVVCDNWLSIPVTQRPWHGLERPQELPYGFSASVPIPLGPPMRTYTVMTPKGMRGASYRAATSEEAVRQAETDGEHILDVQEDILVVADEN